MKTLGQTLVAMLTTGIMLSVFSVASAEVFLAPMMGDHAFSACIIGGQVVWPQDALEPSSHLTTACPIQIERDGRFIKMSSAKWIVWVSLPQQPVVQRFRYIWGDAIAAIGDQFVVVAYGPLYGI
jgi:hypothetical protein